MEKTGRYEIIVLTAVCNKLLEIPLIQSEYTEGYIVEIYL
jgi:hypothetical protein